MLFNAIWSLLVLAYLALTPLYMERLFHRLVALGALALTVIFWFAGSIALAVYLGTPYGCSASAYCGSIQAAVAFGFFLWCVRFFSPAFKAAVFPPGRRANPYRTCAPAKNLDANPRFFLLSFPQGYIHGSPRHGGPLLLPESRQCHRRCSRKDPAVRQRLSRRHMLNATEIVRTRLLEIM
jgi:hypothetical protein